MEASGSEMSYTSSETASYTTSDSATDATSDVISDVISDAASDVTSDAASDTASEASYTESALSDGSGAAEAGVLLTGGGKSVDDSSDSSDSYFSDCDYDSCYSNETYSECVRGRRIGPRRPRSPPRHWAYAKPEDDGSASGGALDERSVTAARDIDPSIVSRCLRACAGYGLTRRTLAHLEDALRLVGTGRTQTLICDGLVAALDEVAASR